MPVSRVRKSDEGRDGAWYEHERHANQVRNATIFSTRGWYYCDAYSFYRSMFPKGFLQAAGDDGDGKPNAIVLEDTGSDVLIPGRVGRDGRQQKRRVVRRYTMHDDLELLDVLRDTSIDQNTFVFLAPVSYYGKARSAKNARYLHAFMIDLDYVGEREVRNLLYQMDSGFLPYANYLVSSGTGLHVVYLLDKPFPLMTRYVPALQAIKSALTDKVWNAYTSHSDPGKRQHQGIYQAFRMIGTPTKLNGAIGNPKVVQPYVAEAFSHDATPPATIPYLLSFLPSIGASIDANDDLGAVARLSEHLSNRTPLSQARELWPEWYAGMVKGESRRRCEGWTYGRAGYDDCLAAIKSQVSVGHRYWCVFYLAVMANKCGVSYEELEGDAYDLLVQFDSLSNDPYNRFTSHDVEAALKAYDGGASQGRSRRYTKSYLARRSCVTWPKRGTLNNPPDKRLPPAETLAKARTIRDLHQKVRGSNWWDNGNRNGAPKKAMQVWAAASEHPEANHSQLARLAGVSRPTVIKWLSVTNWQDQYQKLCMPKISRDVVEEATAKFAAEVEARKESLSQGQSEELPPIAFKTITTSIDNPRKTPEEIAAMVGLPDGSAAQKILDDYSETYFRLLMGIDEEAFSQILGATDTGV